MRKSILFASQPAPCQHPRRSRLLRACTLLAVLAASTALFAVQLVAQTPAASPSKPAADGAPVASTAPKAPTASQPPAPAASKAAAPKSVHKQVHPHKHPAKENSLAAKAPVTPAPVVTPPTPEPPHWPANDKPADASVTWDSRGLLITAQNSSLKQILEDVSAATGAKVEGLGADQRIFGAYGPGKAREVLSQLLDGTGYNVLMIGDQGEGTPRQIVLTTRGAASVQAAAAANPAPPAPNAAEEEGDPNDEPADADNGAKRLGRHVGDHNEPVPTLPPPHP